MSKKYTLHVTRETAKGTEKYSFPHLNEQMLERAKDDERRGKANAKPGDSVSLWVTEKR